MNRVEQDKQDDMRFRFWSSLHVDALIVGGVLF
jgi:hypothetical protein